MRLVALFTALLFATTVNAQVALKTGDPAPNDGVFLTNEQAAKILAEKEAQEQICKANTDGHLLPREIIVTLWQPLV